MTPREVCGILVLAHFLIPAGQVASDEPRGGRDSLAQEAREIPSFKPVATLRGHETEVTALRFSSDGKFLLSGDADGNIVPWKSEDGSRVRVSLRPRPSGAIRDIFAPGKQFWVADADGNSFMWFTSTWKGGRFGAVLEKNSCITLSHGRASAWTLAGYEEGQVRFLLQSKKVSPLPRELHQAGIRTSTASADGGRAATGDSLGKIHVWKVVEDYGGARKPQAASLIKKLTSSHKRAIASLAFSMDGNMLVSGDAEGNLAVWDIEKGATIKDWSGHTDSITALAFHPEGEMLVSGDSVGTLYTWNSEDWSKGRGEGAHTGAIRSIVFSPNGKQMATGSVDSTIKLFRQAK